MCKKCGRSFSDVYKKGIMPQEPEYEKEIVSLEPKQEKEIISPYRPTIRYASSNVPIIAGILLFVSGLLAILNGVLIFSLPTIFIGPVYLCIAIMAICGLIALAGGIYTIRDREWGVALIASIVGLFSIGPLFISSILSLVVLILITVFKEKFN